MPRDDSPIPRPYVMARTIVAVIGGILFAAGVAFGLSAIFGAASLGDDSVWPLRRISELPLPARVLLAVLLCSWGCLLIVVYARASLSVRTMAVRAPVRRLRPSTQAIRREAAALSVSADQAMVYWQSLIHPEERFLRISENAEYGNRTMRVRSTFTIDTRDLVAGTYVIPLVLARRGSLQSGITFSTADGRISSLTHTQSIAFALAAVRTLISQAGSAALDGYDKRPGDEVSLARTVERALSANKPMGRGRVRTATTSITKLPCDPHKRIFLVAAASIVAHLRKRYPLCVPVDSSPISTPPRGATQQGERIIVERIAIAVRRVREDRPRTARDRLESRRRRTIAALNSVFGIAPTEITFPTSAAKRTRSYHLTLRGPEGTYLAHQELLYSRDHGVRVPSKVLKRLPYTMNARYGQRTAHLYVRNGKRFGRYEYACQYRERMPGSMSTAFVGAITTAVIAGAICMATLAEDNNGAIGLLQIMLAFPLALTATSSFAHGAPFWGGDLAARAATIVTVFALAASLWVSTAATFAPKTLIGSLWVIVIVLTVSNALFTLVSWLTRASTQRRFLQRQPGSMQA